MLSPLLGEASVAMMHTVGSRGCDIFLVRYNLSSLYPVYVVNLFDSFER